MIYLDNNTAIQDLYIPRQSAKSAGGGVNDWATKEYVNSSLAAETARTESTYAKKGALSAYTPTTGFTTINGQPITEGGDIVIEGTAWYAGDNIKIEDNTISVTGIPTEFKTINGSAITGNGDLTIEGKVYSAGTLINIDENDTISVTGVSTTSEVECLISAATASTTGWVADQHYLTEHQSLSAYSTTSEVEGMISAATASTTGWVADQHYLTEHQSLSAYSTTSEVEGMISAATASTTGWVSDQHYLTEHQSLSAYTPTSGFSTINGSGITSGGNLTIDTSATVELTQAQYDALVSGGTVEEGTIYVITDAPTIDIDDLASKRLQELDTTPSSPSDGDVVNFEDGLYKYCESSAKTAWFSTDPSNGDAYYNSLVFSNIPIGTVLFEFSYAYQTAWRKVVYEGSTIKLYENDGATLVETLSLGQSGKDFPSVRGSSYRITCKYEPNYFGFRKYGALQFQNIWNGVTSGAHYEKLDLPDNIPYAEANSGIPRWNENGEIITKVSNVNIKNIYINNSGTSYSYRLNCYYSDYANVPEHIFTPTEGGTSGQVLISQGNAAPSWSNWIKSVQITSDAYDALVQAGTTDPNTLYLIVD